MSGKNATELHWIEVDSTSVHSYTWCPEMSENPIVGTLLTRFKHNLALVYMYCNVPQSVYEGLKSAESVGKYLHKEVKSKDFACYKLEV